MLKRKQQKKEKQLETCFLLNVDKHSGRRAREDRWDILLRLTRCWKKLLFLFFPEWLASVSFPPLPPFRWKTTSDQLTVALSSYSDRQLNLRSAWSSMTSAPLHGLPSVIGRQLLHIYQRTSEQMLENASISCLAKVAANRFQHKNRKRVRFCLPAPLKLFNV